MSDITCPYCDKGFDIDHGDESYYEQDTAHEITCISCEKEFVFFTSISFSYDSHTADCLNDGKHQWELTETWPKSQTRMCCKSCDRKRPLTSKERIDNNIPTWEEEQETK